MVLGCYDPAMAGMQRLAKLVLIASVVGLAIAWVFWTIGGFTLADSDAYRMAANRLIHGQELYPHVADAGAPTVFRYAPWFAAAWIPLSLLPLGLGNLMWAAVLLVASGFAVLPLVRRSNLLSRLFAILAATVLVWTSARGNVHPLMMVALIHGLHGRSGPIWVALAASLKAVPVLFVLVYVAQRDWRRAGWTLAITMALVAPMPLLGWEFGARQEGESISLYSQVSPLMWATVATGAVAVALAVALRAPRFAAQAAGVAAILALPRLLLYDFTYLLVGATKPPPRRDARDGQGAGGIQGSAGAQ